MSQASDKCVKQISGKFMAVNSKWVAMNDNNERRLANFWRIFLILVNLRWLFPCLWIALSLIWTCQNELHQTTYFGDVQTTVASQKGPQLSHLTNSQLHHSEIEVVLRPGTGRCQGWEATEATKQPYRRTTLTANQLLQTEPCVSQLPGLEDMMKYIKYELLCTDVFQTCWTLLCIIESSYVCIGQDQSFTKMMNPRVAQWHFSWELLRGWVPCETASCVMRASNTIRKIWEQLRSRNIYGIHLEISGIPYGKYGLLAGRQLQAQITWSHCGKAQVF